MARMWGAVVGCLTIAVALAGCMHPRDLELGGDRYMISLTGNGYAGIGVVEQAFYRHAQEVATAHGFESYKVVEFKSGFEPTPIGFRPIARGTIQLYHGSTASSGKSTSGVFTGTAFAVTTDGVLLTNEHVVRDCSTISVRRFDGTSAVASLLVRDRTNDLALIKIASATPDLAQFRGSPDIRQGDNVIAVGFPLSDLLSSGTALTTGTVSALAGSGNDSRKLQVSTPVQHGNSGGPLLDQSGNVVGIVSSGFDRPVRGSMPQNVNFAIKTTVARAFMDANGIVYRLAPSDAPLATAEIGERARKFTSFVTCTQ